MSEDILILEQYCFICGDDLGDEKKSVFDSTEYSEKKIYKFVETFVGENLEEALNLSLTKAEICVGCYNRFEEYDRICQQAAIIQEEITNLYNQTQTIYAEKIASKSNEEIIECDNCNVQFSSFEELNVHECTQECTVAVSEEFDIDEYETEYEELLPEKPPSALYTCNTCGDTFEKRRDYSSHVKLAHLPVNAEIFTCSHCKEGFFATEMECKLHAVIAHPEDPTIASFECPVCKKTFKTKALITRHFGIHSSDTERPHVCEFCGKTFFHYSSFKAHEKIHFDQRDYACSHCPKTFRSQSHLNRHMKIHTKQKNHACTKCESRFAERYNLTAHMKTHFGISRKKRQSN